jgi:hypothetical protein
MPKYNKTSRRGRTQRRSRGRTQRRSRGRSRGQRGGLEQPGHP